MIDIHKYEGHTEGPWKWDKWGVLQGEDAVLWCNFTEPDPDWQLNNSAIHVSEADEELIADAPLLLAEVKRLRERLSMWEDWFKQGADNKMQDGDAYDIIFHNHDTCLSECSNHCDYKCWICQTNELFE